ncbi:MAG: hypothetical protein HYV25_01140 [Candidatus Harrisonbacteria bacterium]|nr:hypothetical protein [Candidatus Harrisonbacteria bacterium]
MEFFAKTEGERLDKFLAERVKKFSRAEWQRFIKGGSVNINGRFVAKPAFTLRAHDRVTILEEKIAGREKEFAIEPEPGTSLDIIYEDDDIVVVNKPAIIRWSMPSSRAIRTSSVLGKTHCARALCTD